MLLAADAMIIATWLPNPDSTDAVSSETPQLFEPTLGNMEHIAAAAAAVQNLLLLATAAGWLNYWSSGGGLRSTRVFELLQIPNNQVLLGAIFLFGAETGELETATSKLTNQRSKIERWARQVSLQN